MGFKRVRHKACSRELNFDLIVIYKGKLAWDVCAHCITNQNTLCLRHFLCFINTPPLDMNHRSFINEAPG